MARDERTIRMETKSQGLISRCVQTLTQAMKYSFHLKKDEGEVNHQILECSYIEPLNLIRIWGYITENADEVLIFFRGKCLGKALLNVYVKQPPDEFRNGQRNYVFSAVALPPRGGARVLIIRDRRIISIAKAKLLTSKIIPDSLTTSIGTKNSITINEAEKEQAYCIQQQQCYFKPPLKFLHIESSSLCNLRCRYCVVSNNYNCIERGPMSDAVLSRAIEIVNQNPRVKTIQVSGLGEPLTNPAFCDMLERIERETKIETVWFFTNAMLLTPEISQHLAKRKINLRIVISIDGNTPAENDFFRRGSSYAVIKKNLITLLKKIRNKPNFDVQIHNLIVAGENDKIVPPNFLLNDFGFLRIDTHRAFYFPELSDTVLLEDSIRLYKNAHKKICKRMFEQATIRSNGDVIRCHWDSTCSIIMGNILHEDFFKIWHSDEYVQLRKAMMPEVSMEHLPEACQKCHAMNDGYIYRDDT